MSDLTMRDAPESGFRFQAAVWQGEPGCLTLSTLDEVREVLEHDTSVVWINLIITDPARAKHTLVHSFGFHPTAAEDAVEENPRPLLRQFPDYLFLSVHQICRGESGEEEFPEIGIFLGRSYLVTVSHHDLESLRQWFESWHADPNGMGEHPAMLLHSLLDELLDDYFPATDDLETEIDQTEERLYNEQNVQTREILDFKRRLLEVRRKIAPTRDILNALLRRDLKLIPDRMKIDYQDLYDRSLRVIERIDVNRDILSDLMSAHQTQISNNLNQVMKVLTVVSTVLMTMAFWTGLYGMNFAFMPELKMRYGYPLLLGVMALCAVLEVWYFRRRRWI